MASLEAFIPVSRVTPAIPEPAKKPCHRGVTSAIMPVKVNIWAAKLHSQLDDGGAAIVEVIT